MVSKLNHNVNLHGGSIRQSLREIFCCYCEIKLPHQLQDHKHNPSAAIVDLGNEPNVSSIKIQGTSTVE